MNFQKYDLGQLSRGQIVEITLRGSAANVRLMDSINFQHFKSGRKHKYFGGLVTKSPFQIVVPRSAHWYVTIDLNGLRSRSVRAAVNVVPGPLPQAKPARGVNAPLSTSSPLSSLIHEPIGARVVNGRIESAPTFDVFVSHASEDKDEVARPLAHALRELSLDVWYDEFTLRIRDNLRQKIDEGIANSRFGVIVLSTSFFSKGWSNHELDGLVTRTVGGDQEILPIWHGLTQDDVKVYSPTLANRLARDTSRYSIREIAEEIAEVVKASKANASSDVFTDEGEDDDLSLG